MTTPHPPPPPPPPPNGTSLLPPLPPPKAATTLPDPTRSEPPPPATPPPPPAVYKFRIENREVKTTVIESESDLLPSLSEFLSFISSDRKIKRIVGLDIEKSYTPSPDPAVCGKVAVLKLCAGRRCLIIHLLRFRSVPPALACLLDLPDLAFVGVGIGRCVAALERDYGLGCRNAVDLGKLAATVKEKPYLTAFGLADLANENGLLNVSVKSAAAALSDWGANCLSSDQVKAATVDAFLSFHIGNQLLGGLSL